MYKKLSIIRSIDSPVKHRKNSNWMLENDYCSFNIRALNLVHENTGNFFDAMKLLPLIRPNIIHLCPFFDCHIGSLYAIDTIKIISDECIDMNMYNLGLTRENQLQIFIDSVHLLNKMVGFDFLEFEADENFPDFSDEFFKRVFLPKGGNLRYLWLKVFIAICNGNVFN